VGNESKSVNKKCDTLDGRNPAPLDRWFIPLFILFIDL
jgi:hypothetical protein